MCQGKNYFLLVTPTNWHSIWLWRLSGIYSDMYSDILPAFSLRLWHSGMHSDIRSGILSGIWPDKYVHIYSGSLSGILPHNTWHEFWLWHSIWHMFWLSIWRSAWYSIWYRFWQSIWHSTFWSLFASMCAQLQVGLGSMGDGLAEKEEKKKLGNVPIEHHLNVGNLQHKYLKVMFKIPKMVRNDEKREEKKKRGGVALFLKTRDAFPYKGETTCQGAPHCGADAGAIAIF